MTAARRSISLDLAYDWKHKLINYESVISYLAFESNQNVWECVICIRGNL